MPDFRENSHKPQPNSLWNAFEVWLKFPRFSLSRDRTTKLGAFLLSCLMIKSNDATARSQDVRHRRNVIGTMGPIKGIRITRETEQNCCVCKSLCWYHGITNSFLRIEQSKVAYTGKGGPEGTLRRVDGKTMLSPSRSSGWQHANMGKSESTFYPCQGDWPAPFGRHGARITNRNHILVPCACGDLVLFDHDETIRHGFTDTPRVEEKMKHQKNECK